jgi:hypothetical protein
VGGDERRRKNNNLQDEVLREDQDDFDAVIK